MNRNLSQTRHSSPVDFTTRGKPGRGRATGRVSKRQWLDAALGVLASDGVEAVRIVSLARSLNISKSGFYWHFKNRDDLLEEMKIYWIDKFSQRIISEISKQDNLPEEKLLATVRIIREKQSG